MAESFYTSKSFGGNVDKSGVFHWLMQRVTAVVLIPLPFWLVLWIKHLYAFHEQTVAWLSEPLNGVYLVISAVAAAYHAGLGMQTIFDDYVQHEILKRFAMWLVKLSLLAMLVAMLGAVWQIGAMN